MHALRPIVRHGARRHTALCRTPSYNVVPRRNVNAWGMRAMIGLVMVVSMFLARRWAPLQRRRIRKRLRNPAAMSNFAVVERPEEEKRLRDYLANPPCGPVVIVGPEGCGKSNLIKKVLSGRVMSMFLDLRAGTIISGDELVVAFIQQSGYLLPSTDPFSAMLIKGDKKNKISGQELNTALDLMQEVLNTEKARGWKKGIPAICIDHVHSLGSSVDLDPKKPKVSDDPSFLRLIDWVITVTDQKLAHVFFTTTTAFAALDLDRNTTFRDRRTLFYVHFLPTEQAKTFLAANFNSQLPTNKQLEPAEVDTIINTVGGHLRDLENVLDCLLRGDGFMKALRKLITENVQFLVGYMEMLLENYFKEGKEKDGKSKKESCESYLRFWDLMQKLVDNELIDRREIISSIFKEKPKELDNFFVAGIIRYVVAEQKQATTEPEPANDKNKSTSSKNNTIPNTVINTNNTIINTNNTIVNTNNAPTITTKNSNTTSNNNNLTNKLATNSPSGKISSTNNPIKNSTINIATTSNSTTNPTTNNPTTNNPTINNPTTNNPTNNAATTNMSSTKPSLIEPTTIVPTTVERIAIDLPESPAVTSSQAPEKEKDSKEKEKDQESLKLPIEGAKEIKPTIATSTSTDTISELLLCEQFYIAAGSPRMRTCFKLVLSDPHNRDQRDDILKYLKKQKLKDKEKELDEKRKFWLDELKQFSERVDGMIRHSPQWREVVGADNFSKKVDQALTAETQTLELLRNAEEELTKVRADLDNL